ncbi:hypothetical protein VTN49DRAFT_2313 [Thermomyces lanuginosus]|uniref:uncharacterized protein n=1 Tax=Thermomyces lanuginosus TaxID=5541 RepID=UPI0037421C2B
MANGQTLRFTHRGQSNPGGLRLDSLPLIGSSTGLGGPLLASGATPDNTALGLALLRGRRTRVKLLTTQSNSTLAIFSSGLHSAQPKPQHSPSSISSSSIPDQAVCLVLPRPQHLSVPLVCSVPP